MLRLRLRLMHMLRMMMLIHYYRETSRTTVHNCQEQDRLKVVSDCLYVRDAMYSSYTSILLVVVTHCCLHSRYQQAEIGRAGTSRHPALENNLCEVFFQSR
jgi:hypothetical protein